MTAKARKGSLNREVQRRFETFYAQRLQSLIEDAHLPEAAARDQAMQELRGAVHSLIDLATKNVDERQGFLPVVA